MYSLKVVLLYSTLLFLLYIFGDSSFQIVIGGLIGLSGLGWMYWYRKIGGEQLPRYYVLLWIWVFLLISLILSFVYTHSIPLSINSVIFFASAAIIFWVALLSNSKSTSRSDLNLLKSLPIAVVFATVGAAVLSCYLLLNPDQLRNVSTINVVSFLFGHNHLSSLLILSLPISWYYALQSQHRVRSLWLGIITFLTLMLLLSFSRVSLFIVAFQLIFFLKSFQGKNQVKKPRFWHLMLSMVIGGLLVLSVFSLLPRSNCHPPLFQSQLCKSLVSESRPEYWRQALEGFKSFPIFGYGPGTFDLISRRFSLTTVSTSLAHNAFLQQLAETGILGGASFLALMTYLLSYAIRGLKLEKGFELRTAVSLAVLGSYLTALFDFNWSFWGIYFSTLLLAVWLVLDREREIGLLSNSIKKSSGRLVAMTFNLVFITICTGLVGAGLFFMVVTILFRSGRTAAAFEFAPFFSPHQELFIKSAGLSEKQQKLLQLLNSYEPEYYKYLLAETESPQLEAQHAQILLELEPITATFQHSARAILATQGLAPTVEYLDRRLNIVARVQDHSPIHWQTKMRIGFEVLQIADELFISGDGAAAGRYYHQALLLQPSVLSLYAPIFTTVPVRNTEQLRNFFLELKPVQGEYFGQFSESYQSRILELLKSELVSSRTDSQTIYFATRMRDVAGEEYERYSRDVLRFVLGQAQENLMNQKTQESRKLLTKWFQVANEWSILYGLPVQKEIDQRRLQKQLLVALEHQEFEKAEVLAMLMHAADPYHFWAVAQLGHFYSLQNQPELAKAAFERCIKWYRQSHADCQVGLTLVMAGQPRRDRFGQVADIILQNKNWQDFLTTGE